MAEIPKFSEKGPGYSEELKNKIWNEIIKAHSENYQKDLIQEVSPILQEFMAERINEAISNIEKGKQNAIKLELKAMEDGIAKEAKKKGLDLSPENIKKIAGKAFDLAMLPLQTIVEIMGSHNPKLGEIKDPFKTKL